MPTLAAIAHQKVKAKYGKPKKKEKSVNWWKKKAWAVFSRWIRARDNYTCITCGKVDRGEFGRFMQAGHYISRRYNATLFHEKNSHAQCMNCNLWGYGNMGVYTQEMIKRYGPEIIDELTAESKKIKQFTKAELEEIIKKYAI